MADLKGDYAGMDTESNDFPANTTTSGLVETGWKDYGVISQAGDVDWFKVKLTAGVLYGFSIEANSTFNGLFDPQLSIYGPTGSLIATATTGQGFQSKYIEFTPSASADYFLSASGIGSVTGNYILTVPTGLTAGTSSSGKTVGTDANDTFASTSSNDAIDGGLGIDTVTFSGNRNQYTLTQNSAGYQVQDNISGRDGLDSLENVERLRFSDVNVALDLAGNAGTTAKILGAVFGREFVSNKQYAGIGLQLLDGGTSYSNLMQTAIEAKLGGAPSNIAVVNLLYTNVVGTAPGKADSDYYVGLLDSHVYTAASLGIMAADTSLNTANINLVGLSQTGLEYA
ncbi:MAG: hypothetical protein ACXWF8_14445 [Methylobacter sp.]